jgi:hypothetical protein
MSLFEAPGAREFDRSSPADCVVPISAPLGYMLGESTGAIRKERGGRRQPIIHKDLRPIDQCARGGATSPAVFCFARRDLPMTLKR